MSVWDHIRAAGYTEPGPLPEWLQATANAVLADLQDPQPVDLEVRYSPGTRIGDIGTMFVVERGELGMSSIAVPSGLGEAELLVAIAVQLQEQVFPELAGAWGEARPECPGHPHPAQPAVLGGQAYWVCPRDVRRIRPIGHSAP